jgi:hypothetical protein
MQVSLAQSTAKQLSSYRCLIDQDVEPLPGVFDTARTRYIL